MKFFASPSFWEALHDLPSSVQDLATKNFDLLKTDPHHPSLHLKQIGKYWSVRIGRKYRALGVKTNGDLLWFWIGTHAEYDRLIDRQ